MKPHKCKKVHKVRNYATLKAEFVAFVKWQGFVNLLTNVPLTYERLRDFVITFLSKSNS